MYVDNKVKEKKIFSEKSSLVNKLFWFLKNVGERSVLEIKVVCEKEKVMRKTFVNIFLNVFS